MAVETHDPFVAFLYEVLRDYLPVGVVQSIVSDQVDEESTWILTDEQLASIATRMHHELLDQEGKDR